MRAGRLISLSSALLLLMSSGVVAGQDCAPDDTPLTCWRKHNNPVLADVAKQTAKMVGTTNTGTPTATTLGTATALRDFLSFFTAGVDTGKVTENGTSVTLDSNVPFPFFQANDRIKIQAVFSDPNLAEDVQTALGSKSTAAKDKLINVDDIATLFSYSPVSRIFGRSIAPHVGFLDVLEDAALPDEAAEAQRLGEVFIEVRKKTGIVLRKNSKFSEIPDAALQRKVIAQVEKAAEVTKESVEKSSSILKALARLLNNQPQVYVSGGYHYRSPLVGPDEWSAKATFEIAPKSLNRFLRDNEDICSVANLPKEENGQKCAARLVAFAGTEDAAREPDTGNRLAASIEYRQAKGESVDLSEFLIAAPVARKRTHSLVYSLTYGQPLAGTALKNTRIDVAVNYQDVSNDPAKKDRLVASLTLSQKISDTMTLPLSVTYANHTEYLPQTDRHFGVHFGISYKIPDTGVK